MGQWTVQKPTGVKALYYKIYELVDDELKECVELESYIYVDFKNLELNLSLLEHSKLLIGLGNTYKQIAATITKSKPILKTNATTTLCQKTKKKKEGKGAFIALVVSESVLSNSMIASGTFTQAHAYHHLRWKSPNCMLSNYLLIY